MLHVLTHDGNGSKSGFCMHRIHSSICNLVVELAVQYVYCFFYILLTYTDRGWILWRSLWNHKYRDTLVGKSCKDTAVYTDDTHHGKTGYSDERSTIDRRDTLDRFLVTIYLILDNGTRSIWIEGILYLDWDIVDTNWVDSRRVDNLCTEVAKLHSLNITQFVDRISWFDDTWIGCHKSIYVSPDFKDFRIQCSSNDSSSIVTTTTTEVGGTFCIFVAADETRNERNARKVSESILHQFVSQLAVEGMFPLAIEASCLDEVTWVKPLGATNQCGNNLRAESFSIAHDSILSLLAEVVNQIHTEVDALQLFEEGINWFKKIFSICCVGDDGIYHLMVAINHGIEFDSPWFITLEGKLRGLQEFVSDTAKCAHDNHYTLFLCLIFNDTFQAEDAFYGTNWCSAEF